MGFILSLVLSEIEGVSKGFSQRHIATGHCEREVLVTLVVQQWGRPSVEMMSAAFWYRLGLRLYRGRPSGMDWLRTQRPRPIKLCTFCFSSSTFSGFTR